MRRFSILMGIILMSSVLEGKPFYGHHEEGWFWYQKEEKTGVESDRKSSTNKKTLSTPSQTVQTAQQKVKQIQENFEEATAKAILNPTLSNVQEVMMLQWQIIDRSSEFQERWMQASLFEGQYVRPEDNGTPIHRKIMQEQKEKELQHKIRRLAKETGLFFIFKQSCPHCHAFTPVVKEFAQQYGFEVKAISGDGGKLKEFPEAVPDNGIIQKVNVKGVYPALFLAHPPTGNVIPVAWGMTTPTQLMDNFTTIIKALERQDFNAS
jgi:conjugal transfer pilus assembly protein TraF